MAVDVASRTVQEILEHVLDGNRLADDDAATLLRSRDLVSVGRAADELRGRKTDPDEVTFIVDRNVNYTNVCVTDCNFCAFYRQPGDEREGYVPNVVYSCGSMLHGRELILPYAMSDKASAIATIGVDELLTALQASRS